MDTSYFETKIGQQLNTDMQKHNGIIVGFLNETKIKNFAYLKAQVDLDSTDSDSDSEGQPEDKTMEEMIADPEIAIRRKLSWFSYVMEDKSILMENPFLLKTAKLVKTSDLEFFTDLSTIDSDDQTESDINLVVFLPITFRLFNSRSRNYRIILKHLLKVFSDMDYLTIKDPLGCFQVDQAIECFFQLEKKFWDQMPLNSSQRHHIDGATHVGNLCVQWLLAMRIRNHTFSETTDFDSMVSQINDTEFPDNPNNIYTMGTGVISSETYEKSSAFQKWKENIPFQPLPISKYFTIFSQSETVELFRCLMAHPNKTYFVKIFGLFLSSYRLCHLLMINDETIQSAVTLFVDIMADPQYKYIWNNKKTFNSYYFENNMSNWRQDDNYNLGGRNIFQRMAVILYTEERLLAGNLTTQHRSMMSVDFANLLPIYFHESRASYYQTKKTVSSSPYFPMPQLYQLSMNIPKDIHNKRNKICNNYEFQKRFEMLSVGMFDGLNWKNIFFTGSMAEACYYKNGLYPFEFLMSKNKHNPYLDSDIDLGVWIRMEKEGGKIHYDDERVKHALKTKAEEIVAVVRKNYGLTEDELPLMPKNNRWIISHPKLPRDIDIFSFVVDPAALVYNYHMSTCRVVWQGKDAMVLSSGILSAMLGTCVDRRWFSSSVSIHNRILKQFKRGIGLVLNPQEIKVIIQYFAKYQEKNKDDLDFIENMKQVANYFTHGIDLTLAQNQYKFDRFVHLNLFAEKNSRRFRSGVRGRFHQELGQFIGFRSSY